MLADRTKSEKTIILDHINAVLRTGDSPILESDISFGLPTPIPVKKDNVDKINPNLRYVPNTRLKVIPTDEYRYDNPTDIEYRRVDLAIQYQLIEGLEKVLFDRMRSKITLKEIKDYFCELCKLRNDSIEVELSEHSDKHVENIRIYPIANSLLYIGEIRCLGQFLEEDPRVPLPDAFPNNDPLDGYEYNQNELPPVVNASGFDYP